MEPCLFRHGKGLVREVTYEIVPVMLQWSHVFSDMVSDVRYPEAVAAAQLQWSHVFSDMVRRDRPVASRGSRSGFNGAMSFQTW